MIFITFHSVNINQAPGGFELMILSSQARCINHMMILNQINRYKQFNKTIKSLSYDELS